MSENSGTTQQVSSEADRSEPLPRATQGVMVQQQGDEYFLLDTNNGEVFSINESAARIFQACQEQGTFSGLVEALKSASGAVGQERMILEDVRRAVRRLQELGLCEPLSAG